MDINVIIKKLKIKPGHRVLLLHPPFGFLSNIKNSLKENKITTIIHSGQKYQFIQLFVSSLNELNTIFPHIIKCLDEQGLLWICFPKKSSGIKTDFTREKGWNILDSFGFIPVSQIAIDDTWSALRFKPKNQVRSKSKPDIPEIDYANRKVYPPDDLVIALKEYRLFDKFNKLSFTHQNEHIEAIADVKKPETRSRRILKTIELLNKPRKN